MSENRCRIARERAGLSVKQAARLLGDRPDAIEWIENASASDVSRHDASRLAELYGVGVEWMLGAAPRRDYARVDAMRGAEKLSFHDRDELAEFAASLPKSVR